MLSYDLNATGCPSPRGPAEGRSKRRLLFREGKLVAEGFDRWGTGFFREGYEEIVSTSPGARPGHRLVENPSGRGEDAWRPWVFSSYSCGTYGCPPYRHDVRYHKHEHNRGNGRATGRWKESHCPVKLVIWRTGKSGSWSTYSSLYAPLPLMGCGSEISSRKGQPGCKERSVIISIAR